MPAADINTPTVGSGNYAPAPKMVLPSPAPQNEAAGLKNPDTPQFEFAHNPMTPEQRVHPDVTRHPTNMRYTRNPSNRSR